jgi:hypothetical protein
MKSVDGSQHKMKWVVYNTVVILTFESKRKLRGSSIYSLSSSVMVAAEEESYRKTNGKRGPTW